MATRDMPWVPANMTTERRKRVEAFSRLRRVSRAEAAGMLIDAGIEAMRPTIAAEVEETRNRIRAAVGVPPTVIGEGRTPGRHEAYVIELRDNGYFNRNGDLDAEVWHKMLRLARSADRA